MATVKDWIEGARLRTLAAGISPVIAGTGIAMWLDSGSFLRFVLAALVALGLQIGSNFSNDYSDGIRGTDDVRTGPARLTGGGKAKPELVKAVAFACYGAAGVFGLILVAVCGQWWLLVLGVLAVLAAWYYTGGAHPYGYMGLGEVFVFVFFGLMAGAGTVYTQALSVPWQAWWMAASVGFVACAVLMANNIRDIPTDRTSGKMTLAVRLGDTRARLAYDALVLVPVLGALAYTGTIGWRVVLFLPALALALRNVAVVEGFTGRRVEDLPAAGKRWIAGKGRGKAKGLQLIPVLRDTGFVELAYALAAFIAFATV